MAEHKPHEVDTAPDEETSSPVDRNALLGKTKIAGFVAVVIIVECLIAYMYVPSEADLLARIEGSHRQGSEDGADGEFDDESADKSKPAVEVDLGEFDVSAFQPRSNSTLRISFRLFGTVLKEEEPLFLSRMEDKEHRFREQVIVTIRSSDTGDLTDAGLGLIKRKILEKTNRILGKPLLQTVIVSDFSLIEQ